MLPQIWYSDLMADLPEKTALQEWKKCSVCKKSLAFGSVYYVCSQKACQSPRLGLHFCSYLCWDSHKGMARHRDAWAEEMTAPKS